MRCNGITLSGLQCKKQIQNNCFCAVHRKNFEECGICLNERHPNIIVNLECGHKYCRDCIYRWVCEKSSKSNCPMCRKIICDEELHYQSIRWGLDNDIMYSPMVCKLPLNSLDEFERMFFTHFVDIDLNVLLPPTQFKKLLDFCDEQHYNFIIDKLMVNCKNETHIIKKIPNYENPQQFYVFV